MRVSEAPSYSQTVMTYDPGSPGAMSYLDAARELAEKGLRPQEGHDRERPSNRSDGGWAAASAPVDPDQRPPRTARRDAATAH